MSSYVAHSGEIQQARQDFAARIASWLIDRLASRRQARGGRAAIAHLHRLDSLSVSDAGAGRQPLLPVMPRLVKSHPAVLSVQLLTSAPGQAGERW